jgi:hypothetical protein
MTQAEVRALALSLPETSESSHHGTPDVRVRNRIFATFPPSAEVVNLKSAPQNLELLVRRDPATFSDAWGGRWLGVRLDRVPDEAARELVRDAWTLAAPRSLFRSLRRDDHSQETDTR